MWDKINRYVGRTELGPKHIQRAMMSLIYSLMIILLWIGMRDVRPASYFELVFAGAFILLFLHLLIGVSLPNALQIPQLMIYLFLVMYIGFNIFWGWLLALYAVLFTALCLWNVLIRRGK